MDIQQKLHACQQAMRERGAVDQIIMQGIFFGLPRSGKTSTKRRLVGKGAIAQQPSTGVAENVSHVEIEKSTVQFVSQLLWNEVTDLNEETAMIVDDICNHITRDRSDDTAPDLAVVPPRSPASKIKRLKHTVVHHVKEILEWKRKSTDTPKSDTLHKPLINPVQVLDSALHNAGILLQGHLQHLRWMLYLSDVGGQPEFQEMLPALVSGPSLYFLTFPLHKGLNEKCLVEYQHPNGNSIIPYTASFTMKEALLSSLASIASTRSYIKVDDENAVYPKVLFIATHKDQVESEKQLQMIDKELQEAIKGTAAYHENMIEFQSKDQMVFVIDNTSTSEEDIQRIRNAVERIGTRNQNYRIQTPYTWMIFSLILRHQPKRILGIDECAEIGKVCGIETRKDLNNALWYLHHNIGIIRYFQDVPNLQDIVFIDPQYIFDKFTELIVNTFTFEAVGQCLHEEFIKKGIIPTSLLKQLSSETEDIDGDMFAALMEHLSIITPIEENKKYFAPCALSHAELPPASSSKAIIPSVRVTFKSGYCPKGMFGSLVVKLLKKDKLSQFQWTLKQDRIYRNQICLSIGPYDSFKFSLFPTYINIALDTSFEHGRKIPLGSVCCNVRHELVRSIHSVTEALHYTQRAAHSLAFACPVPQPHDPLHSATINFSPDGTPCTLTCPLTHKCYELPNGHQVWFDEVNSSIIDLIV
jgi:GTPase SAR1 family protein